MNVKGWQVHLDVPGRTPAGSLCPRDRYRITLCVSSNPWQTWNGSRHLYIRLSPMQRRGTPAAVGCISLGFSERPCHHRSLLPSLTRTLVCPPPTHPYPEQMSTSAWRPGSAWTDAASTQTAPSAVNAWQGWQSAWMAASAEVNPPPAWRPAWPQNPSSLSDHLASQRWLESDHRSPFQTRISAVPATGPLRRECAHGHSGAPSRSPSAAAPIPTTASESPATRAQAGIQVWARNFRWER